MARSAAARALDDQAPTRLREVPRLSEAATGPHYADPGDVREFAGTLPEKFLHCREMNHNWRPYTVGGHPDGGYERVLRCTRCRTRRVQHLTASGAVISSKYIYPDGYESKGLGRIVGEGRDALRLESIKRVYVED